MDKPRSISGFVLRVVCALYPAELRNRYGPELEDFIRVTVRTEKERLGVWGYPYVLLHILLDVTLRRGRFYPGQATVRSGRFSSGFGGNVLNDLRWGIRYVRRTPWFSAFVVATLTVAIGSNVAIFSIVNGVLIQPMPFPNANQLTRIWSTNPSLGLTSEGPSPGDVLDWARLNQSMQSVAAWYLTSGTHQEEDYVEEVRTAQVTPDFFTTLGATAAVGRVFTRADVTDAHGPVVLGHAFWQRRFAGDSSVIGRYITSSGRRYEVVGVMPADFTFPDPSVDKWSGWNLRLAYDHLDDVPRTWRFLHVVGRLRDGVDRGLAEQDLNRIATNLANTYPESNRGWQVRVNDLYGEVVRESRGWILLGWGAVGFVLLLACMNVSNMFLARLPMRAEEFALRSALGAARLRLVRQVLAEVGILVFSGTAGGLVLGALLLEWFRTLAAGQIPRMDTVAIDLTVVGFTVTLLIGIVVACGLAPALRVTRQDRLDTSSTRRTGPTRTAQRLMSTLIAVQLGLTMVLLVGATVFGRSFYTLWNTSPGFDAQNLLTFRLSLNARTDTTGYIQGYYASVIDSIGGIPGVLSVGASTTLPMNPVGNDFNRPYRRPGEQLPPSEAPKAQMRMVTAGYFATLGYTFRQGGPFTGLEREDQPLVAVVNETLARRLRADGNVVGDQLIIDFREGWQPYTILGVVSDVRHYGVTQAAEAEIFLPLTQVPYLAMSVAVRTTDDANGLILGVRRELAEIDPGQPAHNFNTMTDLRRGSLARERLLSWIFLLFGAVAVGLSASGVYGVTSNGVSQRSREMGVRLALGATPIALAATVVGQLMALVLIGLIGGTLSAWYLGRSVTHLVFGVSFTSLWVYVTAVAILLMVALVSAAGPAARTARVDPVRSLQR